MLDQLRTNKNHLPTARFLLSYMVRGSSAPTLPLPSLLFAQSEVCIFYAYLTHLYLVNACTSLAMVQPRNEHGPDSRPRARENSNEQHIPRQKKRLRVSRACDQCRRKRTGVTANNRAATRVPMLVARVRTMSQLRNEDFPPATFEQWKQY